MSDPIFFAPLRVPLVDERTGLMSREWILFFQAMYLRIGGIQALSAEDLQLIGDVNDAVDDGSDLRAAVADLERMVALADEAPSTSAADIAELQMLVASIPEDAGGTVASPTAKVGLTAVPGSAFTLMRSDAAPPIDQTIAPSWSGIHAFVNSGAPVRVQPATSAGFAIARAQDETGARKLEMVFCGSASAGAYGAAAGTCVINAAGGLTISVADAAAISLDVSGNAKFVARTGFNNTAPIAKPTATGSRAANAALASLLTALANYGLITDSTTV